MNNKTRILVVILIIIVILCGGIIAYKFYRDKSQNVASNDEEPQNTVEEPPLEVEIKTVQTFKGDERPIAVMIDNHKAALPQGGLNNAYMVYEIIVEGGESRLMALFKGQNLEKIGPVRSSRHYFLDYALENDAIYVHHGQSPQAQSDFSTLGIDRIVADNSKTGWRDKSLNVSSEHTLFTSIEKLNNGLGNKRTTRNNDLLLNYSVDEIDLSKKEDAKVAGDITIQYSNSYVTSYKYDENNKYYLRSVNGKAHTDYVTKEQYHFKNIITYQVKNTTLNDGENKGRQNIENIGSGEGYYITDGYSIPIKWVKESRKSQTKYYYNDGKEIDVNDGNTFIQIQPEGQKLTIN